MELSSSGSWARPTKGPDALVWLGLGNWLLGQALWVIFDVKTHTL